MEGNEEIKTLIVEMPRLPQDIIVEILLRLPVKSLLKFRCVSKSWLSLISSPKFIKTHLTYSTLNPTLSNYRLMQKYRDSLQHFPVNCVFRDRWTDVVAIDCPKFRLTKRSFNIEGSCNGLLLVAGDLFWDGIFLWNPSLRMLKELPLPESAARAWDRIRYGIGYDEPNDDYKVVVLFLSFCTDNYFGVSAVESYSLKNGSWKSIEEFEGGVLASGFSLIYANGKFHFPSSLEPDDISLESDDDSVWSKWDIVSLDLENEVYGTVEPPMSDVFFSIGLLKGCIGALYTYPQAYNDLWVLKEYGAKESWTKLVRIPFVDGPPSRYSGYQFPLCISSNGKVLLGRGNHLVVYDPEDNSFIYYPKNGCRNDKIKSMGMYVESLVPLPNPVIYFKTALEGFHMYEF